MRGTAARMMGPSASGRIVLVTGVPCSDSNVASIAFEHGNTAIGNTLIDIGKRRHTGDASACADNSCGPRTFSAGPARNT